MSFAFSTRSTRELAAVHPDLKRLMMAAIVNSPIDFMITEGRRTKSKQKALFERGATRTLNSRHLTGHAVDFAAIVDGQVRWDWPLYGQIAGHIKEVAKQLTIPIVWGGDWRTFKDGPHIELDRKKYA